MAGANDGHRKRLKTRFEKYGLNNFSDVEAIELLLFYVRARCDTKVIAQRLLKRFETLDKMLDAPLEELESVEGVGKETAVFLRLIPEMSRRYMLIPDSASTFNSSTAAGKYFVPLFMYEKVEVAYMVCTDNLHRFICCRELSRGVVDSTPISVRRIVEIALNNNAKNVILAHNHIGSLLIPSYEDEEQTREIRKALEIVGINLTDHIIVSGPEYISMKDLGARR